MSSDPNRNSPPGWEAQAARFALISDVVLLIARSTDIEQLLLEAVNRIKWVFDFNRCTLALTESGGETYALRTLLETRRDHEKVKKTSISLDAGLHGRVIRTGQPCIEVDVAATAEKLPEPVDPALADGSSRSVIGLPLHAYGRIIGAILFSATRANVFSDEDVKLALQFATHLGLAIDRFRQADELRTAERKAKAARRRLYDAIESVSEGFVLYDHEDRMIVCNSRFKELFHDSGDIVEPGVLFEDMMRAVASTGMVPLGGLNIDDWVAKRVITHKNPAGSQVLRLEHGTWINISEKRIDNGGIVGVYTDITELKEREVEITGAKDAAEGALADLQKAQERLVQAEKMASLGQLTAGIAHEIKNPLNFVNNFAKLSDELLEELGEILEEPIKALDDEARDDAEDLFQTIRQNLTKINEHGRRADSIVRNMLLHSREGPSERQTVNLNAIAKEALNLAYHGARAENPKFNIEMVKALAEDAGEVECFPQDLMRVLLNLINNGMYAANKRGDDEGVGFAPTISLTTRLKGDKIEIEVRDNGNGIPAEVREKIFVPFFTTKPAGEGTGLGLSLSYDIVVKQHGGELTVDSEPGEFTAFRVTVPRILPTSGGNDQ
jgi:signal transduction histidine kinase